MARFPRLALQRGWEGGGLSLTSRRWFSAFSLVVDIDMMKPWCVEVKDVLDEEDVEYLVCM